MKVLVACEESQTVCKAFRARGHEAYSCDIQECSGGHPEWHILGDALKVINGCTTFQTEDGKMHVQGCRWDLIIAHPPCTYLSNVATRSHSIRMTPIKKINERTVKRIDAMDFFMQFVNVECDHVAIENPVGVMNTCYRKPDQTIHPYMFAKSEDDADNYVTKATCLWLKGLNPLKTNNLPKPSNKDLFGERPNGRAFTWEEKLCRAGGQARHEARPSPASLKQWQNNGEITSCEVTQNE